MFLNLLALVETEPTMTRSAALALAAILFSIGAWAVDSDVDTEVRQLLARVAASGCEFERNGSLHASADAADHLMLKYRRGSRYVGTTEDFIDRLASESSWTGNPYHVTCEGKEVTSNEWLHSQLEALRKTTQSPRAANPQQKALSGDTLKPD